MIKFKEFLSKTSSTLTNLLKKYPLTLIITATLTIFLTIFIEGNLLKSTIIEKVTAFGVIWAISTLFIETLNLKNKKITIASYIITAIISFVLVKLPHDTYDVFNEHLIRGIVGYCLCLLALTVYFIIKKENIDFKEYVLKIFNNIFHSSVIYGVLNIGITLIIVIFIELILNASYWDFILRSQILILGLFYFPAMLNSITNVKETKPSGFIKGLVKYVLIPLVAIAMIIIYIYIVKILIQREMPQNIIFRILAGIFIVAFPVWNMASNFKENKVVYKISTILPYAYLPFILLEIYSLGVRIIDFGITPTRYIGIAFILFQIIALLFTVLKKKINLEYILIVLSAIIVIACITPLNYNTVSKLSQKHILESNLSKDANFEDITIQAKEKVYGAYRYLINNYGENYIPDYIKNMTSEINKYAPIEEDYSRIEYIFWDGQGEEIDIKEYSTILPVRTDKADENEYNDGNIKLYDYNNNYIVNVNIKNIVEGAIRVNEENVKTNNITLEYPEKYIYQNRYIHINKLQTLYITDLDITYDSLTNNVTSILLSGNLLKK